MRPDPKKLIEEALKLPPEARAAMAGTLIDSLDDEVDEDAESAWHEEIARRIAEARAARQWYDGQEPNGCLCVPDRT